MFQGNFMCVSRKFQGRFMEVSLMGVSVEFQASFNEVSRLFQGCFMKFLGGFKRISRVF